MALDFLQGILGSKDSFEPQRANNALLYIVGLDGQQQGAGQGTGGQSDILTLSLKSFPIPKSTNAPKEVDFLNESRKFAGKPVFDALTVTYHDYVDKNTASALHKWRYQVYNPEKGTIGLKSQYAKSGFIMLYSPEGSIERKYDLKGLWPSSMDPGEIDMSSDEPIMISIVLEIDKAIPSTGLAPDGNS